MAVLTVLMCFASTNVFAQLKEVRGVQTRVVEYQGDWEAYYAKYNRHGYELTNENKYAVWIEVELWEKGNDDIPEGRIVDAKSFTLKAGETYVWKCGDKMIFRGASDGYESIFVKYKAYKAE